METTTPKTEQEYTTGEQPVCLDCSKEMAVKIAGECLAWSIFDAIQDCEDKGIVLSPPEFETLARALVIIRDL